MNYSTDFESAFATLIGHEGGYVNDSRDPGGETKFGISKQQYPNLNIGALTLEQAKEIYWRDYWHRMQGDVLPQALRLQVFDAAVNSGIGNALRWLQRAAGVAEDGVVGSVTLAAIRRYEEQFLICRFLGVRLNFLTTLSGWPVYGRGWARRVAANLMQERKS